MIAFFGLFATSCSDDDKDEKEVIKTMERTISLEYAEYDLTSQEPLEINAKLSVASETELKIPFTLAGSLVKDQGYTISAEEFVFPAGVRDAKVVITFKENFKADSNIKLTVKASETIKAGKFMEATIGVGVGEKVYCNFNKASEDFTDKFALTIRVTDKNDRKIDLTKPMTIPFVIKEGNTAVYGEHFVFEDLVDDKKEFILKPGQINTTLNLKVLKYEEGKTNFTITIDPAAEKFTTGATKECVVTIQPSMQSRLVGKWVGKSIDDYDYLKESCSFGSFPNDYIGIPTAVTEDSFTVDLSGEKPAITFDMKSDLKNYFRNCTFEFLETMEDPQDYYGSQPNPTSPPLQFHVAKFKLSKANVYFSADEELEAEVKIGFYIREVDGKQNLDVLIYDYAPKAFLANEWKKLEDTNDYMPEWWHIRYSFVRE